MVNQVVYDTLESLAERYIPEGRHELLHIDSRGAWIDLMVGLLEKGFIKERLSVLTKCAKGWEILLTQRISIQN